MNMNNIEKRKMQIEFKPVVELYQSLPVEQCVELYLMQYDNMKPWQRRIILSIIGAKTVYKDGYKPNYKQSMKNDEKGKN